MLHDIALLTGGKTFTKGVEIQPKDIDISDLGHARKITVNKSQTSIHTLTSLETNTNTREFEQLRRLCNRVLHRDANRVLFRVRAVKYQNLLANVYRAARQFRNTLVHRRRELQRSTVRSLYEVFCTGIPQTPHSGHRSAHLTEFPYGRILRPIRP